MQQLPQMECGSMQRLPQMECGSTQQLPQMGCRAAGASRGRPYFAALVALLLLLVSGAAAVPPAAYQLPALAALKSAWGNQTNLASWRPGSDCQGWFGLTCDAGGNVILLNFDRRNMKGKLPSAVGGLTALQKIALHYNSFTGTIPPLWAQLLQVTTLLLDHNDLSGPLPPVLSSMSSLAHLDLSFNSFTGALPQSLGDLPLTTLDLSHNRLTGPIPFVLGQLGSVDTLLLAGNLLNGEIPNDLVPGLTTLTTLDVSSNKFNGTIPPELGQLYRIVTLNVASNFLTGGVPGATLARLRNLRTLDLSYNGFSGAFPAQLGQLATVTTFHLNYNQMSGPLPGATLALMTSLADLQLSHNSFSGSLPPELATLKGLSTLYLDNNAFSGALSKIDFTKLPNLKNLKLANNKLSGTIPTQLGSLRALVTLHLANNALSGSVPAGIAALARLQYFNVAANQLTGALPPRWASKNVDRGFSVHDNYLTGAIALTAGGLPFCPATAATAANCLSRPAGSPPACAIGPQRKAATCVAFCGTTSGGGPCSSHGTCFLNGGPRVPSCACDPGYQNGATPSTCIRLAAPDTGLVQPLGAVAQPHLNGLFRYASLGFVGSASRPVWSILTYADWTNTYEGTNLVQPAKDQGRCGSCWAFASVGAVETAYAIANGLRAPPSLSEQQLLRCMPGGINAAGGRDTCAGGWPGDALDYAHAGLTTESLYPYVGNSTAACNATAVSKASYKSVMWEQVDFYGWFGLLLAVQRQPVVVSINAAADSFILYRAGTVYNDPNCFADQTLNHNVLVVGYQLFAPTPYWVVKNSWGPGWGSQGFMKIAITGGEGVCGMHSSPGLYPVILGANPCQPNPCGGGICSRAAPTGGAYTCTCPDFFVALNNVDYHSQSCVPIYRCRFFSLSPCGVGTCVDDLRGGYTCICPNGFSQGQRTNGDPVCIPLPAVPARTLYTAQGQDTCYLIYTLYSLTLAQFLALNPHVDCSTALKPGTVVEVTNKFLKGCGVFYAANQGDTCTSIGAIFSISAAQFSGLNPGIRCPGSLQPGQQVCVSGGTYPIYPLCRQAYTVQDGDTCLGIAARFHLTPSDFFSYNPGVYCGTFFQGQTGYALPGEQVCVSAVAYNASCALGVRPYVVRKGDTCAAIIRQLFRNNFRLFRAQNRQVNCEPNKLFQSQRICL